MEDQKAYYLTENGLIANPLPDGVSVTYLPPTNNGTSAWIEYQEWLDAGNAPESIPPVIGFEKDLSVAKQLATTNVHNTAYSLLLPTDWVVTREMETGALAPADITTYRAAVRSTANDKVAAIEAAGDLDDLTAYLRSDEFAAWPEPPTA